VKDDKPGSDDRKKAKGARATMTAMGATAEIKRNQGRGRGPGTEREKEKEKGRGRGRGIAEEIMETGSRVEVTGKSTVEGFTGRRDSRMGNRWIIGIIIIMREIMDAQKG
jgi:hypothetical protein